MGRRILDLETLRRIPEELVNYYKDEIGEGTEVEEGFTKPIGTEAGLFLSKDTLQLRLTMEVDYVNINQQSLIGLEDVVKEVTKKQLTVLYNLVKLKLMSNQVISNAIENVLLNKFFEPEKKLSKLEKFIKSCFDEVYT